MSSRARRRRRAWSTSRIWLPIDERRLARGGRDQQHLGARDGALDAVHGDVPGLRGLGVGDGPQEQVLVGVGQGAGDAGGTLE